MLLPQGAEKQSRRLSSDHGCNQTNVLSELLRNPAIKFSRSAVPPAVLSLLPDVIIGHIAHRVAVYCYRSSRVCLLVTTTTRCAKTVEPIETPFGMWTRVGPRNQVLGGGRRITEEMKQFGGISE